jgi:alpha-N-acetylglucosamine transferase
MATLITDDELKNIIMKCPNEDESYPNPKNMLNKNGTCKYAYVTLIMLGDSYIAGAIVLAYSIRNCGSMADLVVLVTPDVSDEGKQILGMYFTHVVEISYVTVQNWRTKKQRHRKYLELVFTKFHIFDLVQYEKILLIDADALVLKYPDHLFTLEAPAGCFLENKDYIITYDAKGNYILPKNGEIEWYKKYCDCCAHGKKIPKEMTDRLKTQFNNSGIGGGLMLLAPKKGELEKIIDDVSKNPMKYLVENKLIWPEQQYLTLRYSGQWTNINPRFFGLQGYPHWKILYGLQYGGDKPFSLSSKADIKTRIQYPDFVLWHQFYYDIIEQHPELLDSNVLKDANEMNKFFHSSIKLQNKTLTRLENHLPKELTNKHINKQIISRIFKVPENEVFDSQLKYYHIERDIDYGNTNLKPMWDDIQEYDYLEPIKRLSKYYGKTSYYTELIKMYSDSYKHKAENLNSQFPAEYMDQIDKDTIMLEYVKCRPNMFVITLWPVLVRAVEIEKILTIIKKYGHIVHTKTLSLTKNALYNLMFLMYDEFTYEHRIEFISKKMDYVQSLDDNEVTFIFLDNVNGSIISGQASKDKKEIRNELMKLMHITQLRGNDLVHINDHYHQTVLYSQMILNDNSIKLLELQNVKNLSSPFFAESRLKLQTFKKWCSLNLSQLEIGRIIIMGGIILYSHGFRKSNDIDAVFISVKNDESQSEEELGELLNDNFGNPNTKFFFADIGIEGSKYWKQSWTDKNDEILSYFGISDMLDLAIDPRNHYYFNGFKCYLFKYEILRKIHRNRSQDHADFIMLSTLYPSIMSQYVELYDGKLTYKMKDESRNIAPELNHNYLKKLFEQIYKKYLRSDIDAFRKSIEFHQKY